MKESKKVVVERLVPAPPQQVFEAWLDPQSDPRVGGKFVIVMSIGGKDIPHRGEYLEIERYTRLVFTWLSPHAGEGSRVTLRFAESPGGQTKLVFEHVGLPDAKTRRGHHEGWSNILKELAALLGTNSSRA
jgi:uncharacterized protein YndB with AHSA1/START domain